MLEEALANADVKPEDVDWLLLHQVRQRAVRPCWRRVMR